MRKGLTMINGIGSSGKGRVDLSRTDAALKGAAASVVSPIAAEATEKAEKVTNPAADLAAQGAPVDAQKVAEIRAAIAEGRYPVDAKAIAEKMIALDLPLKF
jgi:negative regulator of flagellin synthesis FlgM